MKTLQKGDRKKARRLISVNRLGSYLTMLCNPRSELTNSLLFRTALMQYQAHEQNKKGRTG